MSTESARQSQRLLGIIRVQTEIAKQGLDLGGVMALVVQRAQELTDAGGAVIELAEGDDMVYRATSGMLGRQLGLRLPRGDSLSGLCVREGVTLRCVDSEDDPRVNREACRRVGLRSMLVVPLKHHDELVGVLKVVSAQVDAFDATDVQTLELISDLVASSMFHATKYGGDALFHQATHDSLTGLANRALFFDRLRHGLAQAQREEAALALLCLDVDGLKPINDTYGHRAGDAALQAVAARLMQASRRTDTVARVGGDEFAVVLSRVDSRAGAALHSQRLGLSVDRPFAYEGRDLHVGASIGLALYPEDGAAIETLIETADRAMYEAKRRRKGAFGV